MQSQLRYDSKYRYEAIKNEIDFNCKSLVDIGCSDGYFIKRFLQDGGGEAVGIDVFDDSFPGVYKDISLIPNKIYDICFYLDLHYHMGINYFPWIKEHVRTLFVSPSGSSNNKEMENDIMNYFGNAKFIINTAYANRNIYKVIVQ